MESNLIMRQVRQQLHVQGGVRRQQIDGDSVEEGRAVNDLWLRGD
jgi:hypothetical protein